MAIYNSEQLDNIFFALSDPTRREMIKLLSTNKRLNATRLAQSFSVAQPTISKHIKVLEKAQLITRIKSGRIHNFELNDVTMINAKDWITAHQHFWQGSLLRLHKLIDDSETTGESE